MIVIPYSLLIAPSDIFIQATPEVEVVTVIKRLIYAVESCRHWPVFHCIPSAIVQYHSVSDMPSLILNSIIIILS